MYDCDPSFDECIELCTKPIFEETTIEDAMRIPKSYFSDLDALTHYWASVIEEVSNPLALRLEGQYGKTIKFRRYGTTEGRD